MIRFLLLVIATHRMWPSYSIRDVVVVVVDAVRAETPNVSAELMIAIAQHESDLNPCAVSYVVDGVRRDNIVDGCAVPASFPSATVSGYLQGMFADHASASAAMQLDGGMRAGAAELAEWLGTCGGDMACALRGHAGGTRCAHDARRCTGAQRAFVRMFIGRAADLSRLEDSTSTGEP